MWLSEQPLWAWLSVLCKFAESTIIRSLYPFVNSLATMLGVSQEAVALCISLKEVGFTAMPVFGPCLAQRSSALSIRVGGAVAVAACSLLIGVANFFPVFVVSVLIMGAGKLIGETGTQMMVSEFIPREARGRTVAVIEIAWGLSSLLGVPLFGLLMTVGWVWPWLVFTAVGALSSVLLQCLGPRAADASAAPPSPPPRAAVGDGPCLSPPPSPTPPPRPPQSAVAAVDMTVPAQAARSGQLRRYCRLLATHEGRSVAIGAMLLCAVADALFVSFGVWLEEVYQLDLASVAFASVSMGVADVGAELLLTYTMHVLSPPASLSLGWALQLLSYAALPWLTTADHSVVFSVCMFAVQCFAFEYAAVSLMGAATYMDTQACGCEEGDLESLQFIAMGAGRIVGAPLGLKLLSIGRQAGGGTSLLLGLSIVVST